MIGAIVRWLVLGGGILAGLCIAAIMFVISYEVFFRYVLRQPTYWALEVSTYLCVAAVSLGAAYALRENAHVAVEVVYDKLPKVPRQVAFFVAMLTGVFLAYILIRYGVREVQIAVRFNDRSLTPLRMPMAYPLALIPVGGVLLGIQALELLFRGRPFEGSRSSDVSSQDSKGKSR